MQNHRVPNTTHTCCHIPLSVWHKELNRRFISSCLFPISIGDDSDFPSSKRSKNSVNLLPFTFFNCAVNIRKNNGVKIEQSCMVSNAFEPGHQLMVYWNSNPIAVLTFDTKDQQQNDVEFSSLFVYGCCETIIIHQNENKQAQYRQVCV